MTHTRRLHNRLAYGLTFLLLILSAMGCSSLNNTEKGAVVGAAGGAVVGGAIGNAAGSTAKGAIIGAVVGGAAGAIIGNQMDKQARELEKELEGADVERVGEGIQVTFDSGLLFDFDSAALRANARENLAEFAASLDDYDNTEILIVGHTDNVGADAYNQKLSEQRARAAADYLIRQGIPASRIQTMGRGETEPMASNDTDYGRQQNRRVEVAIFASETYREQVQANSR